MSVVNVQTPPVFQHTAARRRLENTGVTHITTITFQHTAARRRLAISLRFFSSESRFQHTAARRRLGRKCNQAQSPQPVSTHSRPKAAGHEDIVVVNLNPVSTHSRPKAAGEDVALSKVSEQFQHTAARRRLAGKVSLIDLPVSCFNTQPPEGGWINWRLSSGFRYGFNTQPPEGGWSLSQKPCSIRFRSPDFAKLPRKARTRV